MIHSYSRILNIYISNFFKCIFLLFKIFVIIGIEYYRGYKFSAVFLYFYRIFKHKMQIITSICDFHSRIIFNYMDSLRFSFSLKELNFIIGLQMFSNNQIIFQNIKVIFKNSLSPSYFLLFISENTLQVKHCFTLQGNHFFLLIYLSDFCVHCLEMFLLLSLFIANSLRNIVAVQKNGMEIAVVKS